MCIQEQELPDNIILLGVTSGKVGLLVGLMVPLSPVHQRRDVSSHAINNYME